MTILLQISDKDYQSLVASNHRLQGSIGLVSPTEGNFNAHRRADREDLPTRYMKLAHGRATVTPMKTRLTLEIDRGEGVAPYQVIDRESQLAADFVFRVHHS